MAEPRQEEDDFLARIERDAAAMQGPVARRQEAVTDEELDRRLARDVAAMSKTGEPTNIGRMAAVGGRALVSGAPAAVFGLPALAADAYGSLVNLARRGYNVAAPALGAEQVPYSPAFQNIQRLSQAGEQLAGMLPVEPPRTPGERILTSGVEAGLGAATGSGMAALARGLIPASVPRVGAQVGPGQLLQQRAAEAAGQYAQSASAYPALTTVGAATGGATARLSAEQGGTPMQNVAAGVAGSILPSIAAAGASRAITPLTSTLNEEQKRLLDVARQQYGLQPSAGQALQIPRLQYMESVAGELPGAVRMQAAPVQQQRAFQSAVMREANIPGELATPAALKQAREAAGGEISRIAESTAAIPLSTKSFSDDLTQVVKKYAKTPDVAQKQAFTKWIEEIASSGGVISGERYQSLRSEINDQARSASKSSQLADRNYGEALRGLRNALDNAFEKATTPQKRADLDVARRDYALAKTIEAATGGAGGTSGLISGPQLRSTVAAQSPTLYRQGAGDLNTLSRIGKEFYSTQPQSGTEARQAARAMMSPAQMAGDVAKSIVAAPFGLVTSTALLNPAMQAYLRNQVMAGRRPPLFTSIAPTVQAPIMAVRGAGAEGLLGQ